MFISGVATVAFLFKFLFRLTEVEDRVSSSSSACNVDRADIHSCESGAAGPGGNQIAWVSSSSSACNVDKADIHSCESGAAGPGGNQIAWVSSSSSACNIDKADIHSCESGAAGPGGDQIAWVVFCLIFYLSVFCYFFLVV